MRGINSGAMKRAARWFSRVREGGIAEQEDRAWSSWIHDDAHQRAYETVELAWELAEDIKETERVRQWLSDVDTGNWNRGERHGTRGVPLRWIASIAATIIAAVSLYFTWPTPVKEYVTAVGEQRKLTLDDGSEVTLNTNSSMTVRFRHALRQVTLARGEADFKVAKDSARPFEVSAYRGVTRAVGTEFDVRLESQAATVTVIEGTVLVRGNTQRADGASATVAAGQAVDYTTQGDLSPVRDAAAAKIRAWQAHHWVFNDETLSEALRDYNRYVDTPVEVRDPSLAERRINGVFRIGDSEAFLNAVEQALKAKATKTDSGILLEPR